MKRTRKEFFDYCCKICERELPANCFKRYKRPGGFKTFFRPYCKRCDSHLSMSCTNGVPKAEARARAAAHDWISTEACDGVVRPHNICRLCGGKSSRLLKGRCVDCRRTINRAIRQKKLMPIEERDAYHERALEDCRNKRWYVPNHLQGETSVGRICRTCNRDLPIEEYDIRADRHTSGVPRRNAYRRECKQCELHFGRCRHRGIPRAKGRELAAAHQWEETIDGR